jgi:hypothetical protein
MKTPPIQTRRVRFPVFESIAQTASALGVPVALIKRAKRDGCGAFLAGNRIDTAILIPHLFQIALANNETLRLDPQQELAKLNAARRREIEDEEKIRRGELHDLNFVDQKVRHGLLMVLRDGLQGLQKKYHRLKETQPDIAHKILENDLPELLEKLRGATVEENDAAPEEMPDDAARIANSDTPKPARAQ